MEDALSGGAVAVEAGPAGVVGTAAGYERAAAGADGLRVPFAVCRRVHRRSHRETFLLTGLLSAHQRLCVSAVWAFAALTDRVADETPEAERAGALARWCEDTLADLDAGRSAHPVRRALVHVVRSWGMDTRLVEEMLAAFREDSGNTPEFGTFADARGYLRGVAGTAAELLTPVFEPLGDPAGAGRRMSVLGELFQFVDILQDLPVDLARGRCYLPLEDLDRLAVTWAALRAGRRTPALDELVERQVRRAERLLGEGAAVVPLVHPAGRPFLRAAVNAAHWYLGEVRARRSAVLWQPIRLRLPDSVLDPRLSEVLTDRPRRTRPRPGVLRAAGRLLRRPPAVTTPPRHVAVIMDGNRRWAAARGRSVHEGHRAGEARAWESVEAALRLGVGNLTLFAFSCENWRREEGEVGTLFDILGDSLARRVEPLHRRGVRLLWAGRRDGVGEAVRRRLEQAEARTRDNTRMTLTVGLDYGGRQELLHAAKGLAADIAAGRLDPDAATEADFARHLYQPDLPEVDLLIRTSGEQRVSNFLPWQISYAELVFDDVLWPDFDERRFREALAEYSRRRRRFGA